MRDILDSPAGDFPEIGHRDRARDSSRSPRGPEARRLGTARIVTTPRPPEDEEGSLIAKVLGRTLPNDIKGKIVHLMNDLKQSVSMLTKATARLERLTENIESLKKKEKHPLA